MEVRVFSTAPIFYLKTNAECLLALQAGTRLSRDDLRHYVREGVDVFMQLYWQDGKRVVSEVLVMERGYRIQDARFVD